MVTSVDHAPLKFVLNVFEGGAQLFNPWQNRKGRFPAWATHFALLLIDSTGHRFKLERVDNGVWIKEIHNSDHVEKGKKLHIQDQSYVVVDVADGKGTKPADLSAFVEKEQKPEYHGLFKNCKHLAFDSRKVI